MALMGALPPIEGAIQTKRQEFWETLEVNGLVTTARAKVPGGWLIMQKLITPKNIDNSQLGNMVFIPDPLHRWALQTEFN